MSGKPSSRPSRRAAPAKPLRFWKYHALGNDYLVLDPADAPRPPAPDQIVRLCHRHFGLGSDGLLYGPLPARGADFGLRIFNPDGSEAEKSGNGLRIFARYLWDRRSVREKPFTVRTPGGVVCCTVGAGGRAITVAMGRVSFRSEDIPVNIAPSREMVDQQIEIEGKKYRFYAATIGNPHCVLPLPEISPELVQKIGPLLERHPLFPNRTNVQLLKILDSKNIQIEIWERGAGYTLASGSSSCAAAAVARKMGACPGAIQVRMPGGRLGISFFPDETITMVGPATRVGEYQLYAEAFDPRRF
jgi:diaminopimelate epimerase